MLDILTRLTAGFYLLSIPLVVPSNRCVFIFTMPAGLASYSLSLFAILIAKGTESALPSLAICCDLDSSPANFQSAAGDSVPI